MILFEGVGVGFNGNILFDNFNSFIAKGDKSVFFSPSGSGKTTLLNMIMGFCFPDRGRVSVDGANVSPGSISIIRRKVSWLPQNVNIFGNSIVREALESPFKFSFNKGLNSSSLINEYLGELGLSVKILDSRMKDLSGGEKQRVFLAICRLLQRPIIALDEPTSALDNESKKKAVQFILSDEGTTVISASHDTFWLDACNNIIEIKKHGNP